MDPCLIPRSGCALDEFDHSYQQSEVKCPIRTGYKKLTQLLNPHLIRIVEQENFYVDTETSAFFHTSCILRLRLDSVLYPLSDMRERYTVETRGRIEVS